MDKACVGHPTMSFGHKENLLAYWGLVTWPRDWLWAVIKALNSQSIHH